MISFTLLRHVPCHDQMWRTQWCPYWGWQIGEKRLLLEFLSHFWDNCCWTHMKVTVQLGREGLDINLSHGQDIDRLQWQLLPMAVFGFKKKKIKRLIQILICTLCKSSSKPLKSSLFWKFFFMCDILGNQKKMYFFFSSFWKDSLMGNAAECRYNSEKAFLDTVEYSFEAAHRVKANFEKLIWTFEVL